MTIKRPIWTPEGVYKNYGIDEYGNVYNQHMKRLVWKINENGYATVGLVNPGCKQKYFRIHRLVMFNFKGLDPNPERTDVNHIDGNKLNNHISNLEWNTRSENLKHAYAHHLKIPSYRDGEANPHFKFRASQIFDILYCMKRFGLSDEELSKKFHCSKSYINHLRNKTIRREDIGKFEKEYEDLAE